MSQPKVLRTAEEKFAWLKQAKQHGFAIPGALSMAPATESTVLVVSAQLAVACSALEWDSNHFGFPIGVLRILDATGAQERPVDLLTAAIREIEAKGWRLAYARVDTDQPHLIHALEETGFRLMDQLLTFRGPVQAHNAPNNGLIQLVHRLTSEQLMQIRTMSAGAFVHSRFYSDKRLNRARVDEMYMQWADSLFEAGGLFLAEEHGRVAGYVACARQGDDVRIQLISVATPFRGQGVGRALIAHVKNHYVGKCDQVIVGTQLANTPAMALYASCGLLPARAELSFHRWMGESRS